ncbi:Ig domain-containing protein [Vibrio sp. HN007]|uniref:Ig-like domain-containing protein n=1 Tax=Vibrio iocasae TaxID=3098914 RepID=UPI0035D3E964
MRNIACRFVSVLFLGLALLTGCSKSDPVVIGGNDGTKTLTVSPFDSSILLGTTQQFFAQQVERGGASTDVSSIATWSSSDASVATVNSSGVATAVATGSAIITATYDGLSESALLVVHNKSVSAVVVFPTTQSSTIGLNRNFYAVAYYADHTVQNVTSSATWTIEAADSAIASVVSAGVIKSDSAGSATVEATFKGIQGTAELNVVAGVPSALHLNPGTATIQQQNTLQYQALLELTNSSIVDVTNNMTWWSGTESVASVSNSTGKMGLAKGLAAGSASIHSTVSIVGSGGTNVFDKTGSLTVEGTTLTELQVSPSRADVNVGAYGALRATAYYSDGTSEDVTNAASWQSSNTSVVKVGTGIFLPGYAYAFTVGQANIIASFGTKTATVPVTVAAPTLVSVDVSPSTATIAVGTHHEFNAVGTYSDGSKQDVTLRAQWSSSDKAVAAMDSEIAGSVKAVSAGSTNVIATLNGVSGTAAITVTSATPTGLAITPQNSEVYVGGGQRFSSTLTFSDSSTQDVTSKTYWTSSDYSILSFPADGSYIGQPSGQAVGVGVAVVTATYTAENGTVYTDTTNFTVTNAIVTGLTVTPSSLIQVTGQEYQLKATASMSGGTPDQNITDTTNWTSSNPEVASVNRYGLVHSLRAGSTTIKATESPYSESVSWTVLNQELINSISISCDASAVSVGSTIKCTATGGDGSGSTADVSSQANWTSSDTAAAAVDEYFEKAGTVTGKSAGSTNISATINGVTSAIETITVNP